MYDILIEAGRVADGSGAPAFAADVAVKDGRIAAVGGSLTAEARGVIDAAGQVVAPGFIDRHTHFDVQLLWDGAAKPGLEHGITWSSTVRSPGPRAPIRALSREPSAL